ncbi:DUF1573 domain-containing protein [Roseivirga seohaensis]|uniref:DUF1573 domain-containing protein n=2 Tax=Roseivirga seohaensis TaxID=1914963 RepID=A0A0L8AJT3_9BACT|nr:DUF1573 domain-containing protein [Roseivirga seohaensis]KOF02693.1 hypothetical protein OB69_10275 [Roseivirga seohaensis subsp. aquiponti]KYG84820.1 hypothetical protein AWW67_01880 [Roseivirga seohaensis]
MKTKLSLLSLVALLFIASSCGNADMEKRLATLERRVNQLENGGVVRNNGTLPAQTVVNNPEQNLSANAAFKWDQTLYNFGTIQQGEVVNHTFKFTNSGTEPLSIQSASASCGCTVPSYSREPIAPGGTGEIVVRFDSKGKTGQQSPVITIVANTNPKQTRLSLRGFVQTSTAP